MKDEAFKSVRDQIGYCGIWCGSCAVGNGALRDLTQRYEKMIKDYALKEWAPEDFDFEEFSKGLESLQRMPLCPGCLKGGGRDACEMRSCAKDRAVNDCISCHEFSTCEHSDMLNKMRTGALKAGLFVKTENRDSRQLIDEWAPEVKFKWPSCILFMNDLGKL